MWLPLYSSHALFWTMYIHLHTSCGHLPCRQVGDSVLWNPHALVKSYHLHSEKHRSEKCHEEFVKEESDLGCSRCQEIMIYIHREDYLCCMLWKTMKNVFHHWQKYKAQKLTFADYLILTTHILGILVSFIIFFWGFHVCVIRFRISNEKQLYTLGLMIVE